MILKPRAENESQLQISRLTAENQRLRCRCAELVAQILWVEGATFAKIDDAIKHYGYELSHKNGGKGTPSLVPIDMRR